ncbi:MAG: AAA family ATPase [Chloroflexi bacterium]|nr:AAA family ATPase [Chloroflexota bacterium]
MLTDEPHIILITGIMASGKSTVAQHLAGHFPRSVHLRGDIFRRMIVNGEAEIEPIMSDAALEQLRLRYRLAASTAQQYCESGFTVVYQDVILGPLLGEVVDMLKNSSPVYPLHVVVLYPSADVVAERERHRVKIGYGVWSPPQLDNILRTETPHIGLWLDTSDLSVAETVSKILSQLESATI